LYLYRHNKNQLFQIIKIKNFIDIRYENQINFFLGDNKTYVEDINKALKKLKGKKINLKRIKTK
jgi:hypothetical protein